MVNWGISVSLRRKSHLHLVCTGMNKWHTFLLMVLPFLGTKQHWTMSGAAVIEAQVGKYNGKAIDRSMGFANQAFTGSFLLFTELCRRDGK